VLRRLCLKSRHAHASQGQCLSKLSANTAISERLRAFISSDLFAVQSGVAKSEYWKYHSGKLHANVTGDSIEVTGESGFYVPQRSSVLKRTARKVLRAIKEPANAVRWLTRGITSAFEVPRLLSHEQAFDAVMSGADISIPILSAFAIDHRELAHAPGVFANAASVTRHYKKWSGYEASENIYNHYYYQNILRAHKDVNKIRTILEIGAGNGNFPSILFHDWAPVRVVLIDLPETLAVSIAFLSSVFPEADIVMPHEIQADGLPEQFDFAFLTVDQLSLLRDSSIDMAINCHSFQEMTHEQIAIYFALIQRVCRESGLFFTANRIEKIPCGPDAYTVKQLDPPNRMAEYPWNRQNETLIHEISKLSRLVQLDAVSIRLERIHK
jgi:putative sugar O-methyltransferase